VEKHWGKDLARQWFKIVLGNSEIENSGFWSKFKGVLQDGFWSEILCVSDDKQ
jgi:hypothetical protein